MHRGCQLRVLIVDDQEDAQYLLNTLLTGHGHDVATAANGEEALQQARANPPDLIISDILMPVMDGFRLCREIRKDQRLGDTRFVFYTATYTDRSDAELAMAIGADDFIRKPAEPAELLKRIQNVLDVRSARGSSGNEIADEAEVLRLYSERLVAKLEKRSLDLQEEMAQRKRSEKSLHEAYEILCQSPAVALVWKHEKGWPVTYVTSNVHRLLGYTAEEMLSGEFGFLDVVHPDDVGRVVGELRALSTDASITACSPAPYRILTKSGDVKWVEDQTVVRRDEQGGIACCQGILLDVSDRILAEQQKMAMEQHLRQTQKLESIGTLASGVAHEINNPLTGIINYADIIGRRVGDDKLKTYAQGIMTEGERIARIVRSLLSFARQDRETHSPASIADIVAASLSITGSLLRKEQIQVEIDIPEGLPRIECRSQQIQQVVMNLLTNARDALNERYEGFHENKVVRIRARVLIKDDERWVRTTVEDRGNGIPDEIVQRIFDPFFTTKSTDKGTGLGLSVSFGIMREHQGELAVDSVLGEYTRVHLDLRALDE